MVGYIHYHSTELFESLADRIKVLYMLTFSPTFKTRRLYLGHVLLQD